LQCNSAVSHKLTEHSTTPYYWGLFLYLWYYW